jgi:hypothetical protein
MASVSPAGDGGSAPTTPRSHLRPSRSHTERETKVKSAGAAASPGHARGHDGTAAENILDVLTADANKTSDDLHQNSEVEQIYGAEPVWMPSEMLRIHSAVR